MSIRSISYWLKGIGVIAAYFVSSEVGYLFSTTAIGVSPVWPPTGVALVVVLLYGYRFLPWIFVGAICAHATVPFPTVALLGSSLGNTLEAATGAWLIRKFISSPTHPMDRPLDLAKFVILAPILSTMVSATFGIASLSLTGATQWKDFPFLWGVWWLGDMFGDLVVAPFLLAWAQPLPRLIRDRRWEALLLLGVVSVSAALYFGPWIPASVSALPLQHIFALPLLWATLRFGQHGATTTVLILASLAAWGTAQGRGPFATGDFLTSLHVLQTFIALASVSSLSVASVRRAHQMAELALRNSEALYHSLVENLPLNIFQKDLRGRFVYANRHLCHLLARRPSEIVGRTSHDVYPKDLADKFSANDQTVIREQRVVETVEEHFSGSGRAFVQVVKSPVRDSEGKLVGILGAFWDVTERQRSESQLREAKLAADAANLAKSKFLANMSHEMRTPLGAIQGFVELLAAPGLADAERLHSVQRIKRSVRNLTELIDDILDLSKIEAGKLRIERRSFTLLPELGDVYSMLRHQADSKRLSFRFQFGGAIPRLVESDPARLRQILLNVVGNAIKFTQSGGVTVDIFVRAQPAKSKAWHLVFMITDSGCGIAPDQQSQLFQPFVQADSSMTRRYGGTGLGLILSRRLARALGGDVGLSHSIPGQGSTFVVHLDPGPLDPAQMVEQVTESHLLGPPQPAAPPIQQTLTGLKVLLAEDVPDNQELVRFFLASSGAIVDIVGNGAEALQRATESQYDIILMDIQMPVLDGYAATKQLREMGYQGSIVALTAHAMREDRQRCYDAGCDGYLSKPFSRDTLVEVVSRLSGQRETTPTQRQA